MPKTLYVGNLAPETDETKLREHFSQNGREVAKVMLSIYRKTGKSRGFGFIEMADEEAAEAALTALAGSELDGREIKVGEATGIKSSERPLARDPDIGGGRFGGRGGKRRR